MAFFIVVLSLCIIGCLALGILGLLRPVQASPQSFTPVSFSNQAGAFNKSCSREVVKCTSDAQCQSTCAEQNEGVDMACVALSDPADKTKLLPNEQVCAPRQAIMRCGRNLGGVLTWAGWANSDRMDWECLCQFPTYASNQNCSEFNAGICSAYDSTSAKTKSFYNWNVSMGRPELGTCQCPSGFTRQTSFNNQIPRCVPNALTGLYSDLNSNVGFSYVGCYTNVPGTSVAVTGFNNAASKIGTAPFMAISENEMIALNSLGDATSTNDPACQRLCSDDVSYKCAGASSSTQKVWAVYKKN